MGSIFKGAVSWDRRADERIGVFLPALIGVLRIHFDGLRKLVVRRLDEHASGDEVGRLDCRLEAIIALRRTGDSLAASELEILIPVANRLVNALATLPITGGVVQLRGPDDCHMFGSATLDVTISIAEWVKRWYHGELVDGLACPDKESLDMWSEQFDWLNDDVVVPLRPDAPFAD